MEKYQNILVAVDGSEEAEKAFQKAAGLAKDHEARLVIAHVLDTRAFATIEQYDRTIVSRAKEQGEELLQSYREKAEKYGVVNVQTVIEYGSPKVVIPKDMTASYDIDLVVAGATGLNAVERLVIGSVSESITRKAPCDVLIVRG